MQNLVQTSSPHIHCGASARRVMLDVILALAPACVAAVVLFGVQALWILCVCVASAVLAEALFDVITGKKQTIGDLSAVVTGILLALNLSTNVPLWQCALGSVFAIVVVKCLFGGLGYNFANPAIVGRIAMAMGFAGRMSTYGFPQGVDATSAATPLSSAAEGIDYVTLLLGTHGGVLGETCAIALIIGGVYLIVTKVISPTIPVTYLATVAVLSLIAGKDPIYQLLSGGLLLGAFFMATDYVTSPTTTKGKLVFGIGLGIITCAIRFLGRMNEGVSFAILLMNLMVPYIEVLTRQDRLGIAKVKKSKEGAAK